MTERTLREKIEAQPPERVWIAPWMFTTPFQNPVRDPGMEMDDDLEFIRADIAEAREAAAWIAGRDAAAGRVALLGKVVDADSPVGRTTDRCLRAARSATPPTDPAALDRLIAERVREEAKASYDAMCLGVKAIMDAINGGSVDRERHDELKAAADQLADVSFALNSRYDFEPVWLARGSKERQDG